MVASILESDFLLRLIVINNLNIKLLYLKMDVNITTIKCERRKIL